MPGEGLHGVVARGLMVQGLGGNHRADDCVRCEGVLICSGLAGHIIRVHTSGRSHRRVRLQGRSNMGDRRGLVVRTSGHCLNANHPKVKHCKIHCYFLCVCRKKHTSPPCCRCFVCSRHLPMMPLASPSRPSPPLWRGHSSLCVYPPWSRSRLDHVDIASALPLELWPS